MRIHVNDPLDKNVMERMKEDGRYILTYQHLEKEELMEEIKNIDVLIVRSATKVTKDIIKAGEKKLKMIIRAGVGVDNIDVETAKKAGINVRNTPQSSSISVAELTIGLMIDVSRCITMGDKTLKEGKWEKKRLKGFELFGKTIGILGLGRIGKEVAKRVKAFGMNVIAFDVAKECIEIWEWIEYSDLDDLLKRSDYISIHLPLNENTYHIISFDEFEKMKDGVILINTARGGIVDERALYEYLKSGKVRAAALDVFEVEPPFDDLRKKILSMDNVIATPHIGASTVEAQKKVGNEVLKIIDEFLEKTVKV